MTRYKRENRSSIHGFSMLPEAPKTEAFGASEYNQRYKASAHAPIDKERIEIQSRDFSSYSRGVTDAYNNRDALKTKMLID